jgi:hypothetical protein
MRRVLLAVLMMGSAAAPLRAGGPPQESLFFDAICSTGSFQVCASVRLHAEGNQLRMQVWNLEGMLGSQHTINAIGLYHLGAAWTGVIESYSVVHQLSDTESVDITSFWTPAGSAPITTLTGIDLELQEGALWPDRGIIGCTDPGGVPDGSPMKWETCRSFSDAPYVEFTFNLSEAFALANTEVRWQSTQLPNGGQLKCDTGGAGVSGGHAPCAATVVPEPATVLLMATGLFGMVGVASRRRKKDVDVTDQV